MIDPKQLAEEHPQLLLSILCKSTGWIGEIIVAQRLASMGYAVAPTNNNARQRDLHVTAPDGTEFYVETKTGRTRRPTWWVSKRPDAACSAIWCLLVAPRAPTDLPREEDVEIFVMTVEEAQEAWDASPYSRTHPNNGDIRYADLKPDCRDAWDKLPGWASRATATLAP